MICRRAVHIIQIDTHADDRVKKTSRRCCTSTKRSTPYMNNRSQALNARVGHYWWKLANVQPPERLHCPYMELTSIADPSLERDVCRSHYSQSVNMSLHLNILNIVFDSLSLLLCTVYAVLYCKSLECNHRSYDCTKRDLSCKNREAIPFRGNCRKILGFQISEQLR